MARIRAQEWGTERYWSDRIRGYLDRKNNPGDSLVPRVIYVAMEGEYLIGFVAGHLSTRFNCQGELEWINVVPQHHGGGTGSQLLRLLAQWFVERKAFRICVDVEPDNTLAHRFYMRHGAEKLNKHWLVWKDVSVVLNKL